MSTHHQDAIDELTAIAHRTHAASLQREVIQLHRQIADFRRAKKVTDRANGMLVDAGIFHAFEVHDRDVRISALESVNAVQRKENDKLTHKVACLVALAEQRRVDLRAARQTMRRLRGKQ